MILPGAAVEQKIKAMMQTEPDRRLTLPPRNRGVWHNIKLALGVLLFAGALVAAAIYTAPDLISDWKIQANALPVSNGRVTKGSCSSNLIFNICDATLTVPTKSGSVSRDVNYVFTGVHLGDYTVEVMADPARPELATTDMALDKLINRTLTLLVGGLVLLAMTALPLLAILRRPRATV